MKIIQISVTTPQVGNPEVYGLGDDGKLYLFIRGQGWSAFDEKHIEDTK